MIGAAIRSLINPVRRLRGRRAIGSGQFNRSRPLSREFGYDRGTPIDRYYIERCLEAHAADIHGRVLEVGDDSYSRRFGAGRITKQDILHVQSGNPKATIVGDLGDPETLPSGAFDVEAAVRELRRALAPGGIVLVTVPGVSSIDRGEWGGSWYWSLTELSLNRLLTQFFNPAEVAIQSFGNLFAATAFLHGACVEEVDVSKLLASDRAYPVTVTASARAC
jgi:SAM-dependent methyltransferase